MLADSSERRIVGLRLKNIGMVGDIPEIALSALTALQELDMASDNSKPFANQIRPPTGKECASVEACKTIACDFGEIAPSCYKPGHTSSPTVADPFTAPAIAGVTIGAILVVVLLSGLIYVVVSRRNSSKKKKHRREMKRHGSSGSMRSGRRPSLSQRMLGKRTQSFRKLYRPPKGENSQPDSPGTWVQTFDPVSSAHYWMNTVTGEFSWSPPPQMMQQQQQSVQGAYGSPFGSALSNPGYFSSPLAQQQPREGYAFRGAPGGFGSVGYRNNPAAGAAFPPLPTSRTPGGPGMGGGGGILRNAGNVAAPMPPPLPQSRMDRWEEVYDSATDRSYWISSTTGQISHTPPPAM